MADTTQGECNDLDFEIAELDARLEMITPIAPEPDWWIGGGSGSPKPS